jgi:hypothetical protein
MKWMLEPVRLDGENVAAVANKRGRMKIIEMA